ncbi:hypothetical protein DVH05_019863 [Phytophthora capsici]|nr:hypothetical protein DVH05_019863 [Phytophthora capsici]
MTGVASAGETNDPASVSYSVSAYAVGDWGQTLDKGSCCGSTYNNFDLHAQEVVGKLMDIQAGTAVKPKAVLGHGDSFYWTGIDSLESRDSRFQTTYESRYNGDNIKNVPWVNVMGNHDYGGANYVCNVGDKLVECNTTAEMLQGLENKFRYQADYKSPNDDRWALCNTQWSAGARKRRPCRDVDRRSEAKNRGEARRRGDPKRSEEAWPVDGPLRVVW